MRLDDHQRRDADVEVVGSGLPAGSSGDAPRAGGAEEPMRTAAEDADTRRGSKRSAEADAADAHMSVGKMEVTSRAAAKMTNSAAAVELTSAEIWTLAKMAIELFGASVSKLANKFTSYSIDSSLFIYVAAKRDDGQFWDLGTREDQEKLEQMQQ